MSRKALIVTGGWKGHTPVESGQVFEPLLKENGFDVTVSDTLATYEDEKLMSQMDLIVPIWTMGEITSEQSKGLRDAVYAGAGLAGFHGGIIDSFRKDTSYQFMTGGQWVAHPGNCIPSYTVNITDKNHAITKGIGDFELKDTEQYYCHIDPGVHVLCTTKFVYEDVEPDIRDMYQRGTVMPYAWTRGWGKGKVFVAAWGHTYKDFDVPEARQIMLNGMRWAARGA